VLPLDLALLRHTSAALVAPRSALADGPMQLGCRICGALGARLARSLASALAKGGGTIAANSWNRGGAAPRVHRHGLQAICTERR